MVEEILVAIFSLVKKIYETVPFKQTSIVNPIPVSICFY